MKKVLIPLAQGCEELEAITIIDLLRRANLEVTSAGLDKKPVICSRRTVIQPDVSLDDVIHKQFDLIVLPGGLPGADNLRDDERIIKLIQKQSTDNKLIAAICAAPKVLAHANLLEEKTITCFPGALDKTTLNNTVIKNQSVIQDGNIITSRGPGTAIDFALTLIELLSDKEARLIVEKQMVRD